MASQPQQLQGEVTSFADVQSQPNYQKLPSETQAQIALEYFDKRVASQSNFQKADAGTQETIKQEFRAKYNLPDIKPAHGVFTQGNQAQPVQQIGEGLQRIGQGLGAYAQSVPGQIGQAFQTEFQNSKSPTSGLEKYASTFPSAIEGVRNLLQAPADLATAAANAYTGNQQFEPAYRLPSVTDLPVVGPKIQELRDKYPVYSFLAENALPVDAGLQGLGRLRGAKKVAPIRARVKATGAPYGEFGRPIATRSQGKVLTQGQRIVSDTQKFIQEAQNYRGIDAKATAQMRARALKQAFEQLEQRGKATRVPALQGRIRQAQSKLQEQFEGQKPAKAVKLAVPDKTEKFNKLVDFVQQLRKSGRSKEADVALGQYTRDTKAKVYDEVKRREVAQKQASQEANQLAKQRAQDSKTRVVQGKNIDKALEAQRNAEQKAKINAEAVKRREANEAAKERYLEAQERVKNRQTLDKERAKQLVQEERDSQRLQRQLETEGRKLQNQKDRQAIKDRLAQERAESRNRQRELKQLRGAIEERAKVIAASEKSGRQILDVVEKAAKTPDPKAGTTNEYTASGPDEYKRMSNERKTQAKQQNRSEPATQGQKATQPEAKPASQPIEKAEVAEGFIKPGQALAPGLKTPGEIRAALKGGVAKLSSKGMKALDTIETVFDQQQKVKLVDYIADPNRKKGAPIQGDSLERSIDGLKISKNGNITAMMHTDEGIIRSYSLDSINKIEIVDKPAVEGAYVKAGTLDKMQAVLDRLKSGEAVSAQEIKDAARLNSETEFKEKTKDLHGDKINKIGKEVDC